MSSIGHFHQLAFVVDSQRERWRVGWFQQGVDGVTFLGVGRTCPEDFIQAVVVLIVVA
jgi:hypothetical protein